MTIEQHIGAAIDLGSNTFRLLVAACYPGTMKVLEKKLVTVRLGQGLGREHLLSSHTMERGLETLRSFRRILDRHRVESFRACGTEALRQAENSPAFLKQAEKILLNRIDIISGAEEACLSLAGVLSGLAGLSGPLLLADVGGGSTELILDDPDTGMTGIESIGSGAVNLSEEFLAESRPDVASMDLLLADKLGTAIKKLGIPPEFQEITIIGSGGTATSLAALDLSLDTYDESLVHGRTLSENSMAHLWSMLSAMPAARRNELPCLGDGRGEILPAGLRVYQVLLKLLKQDRLRVSDSGLLEGILLSAVPAAP